MVTVSERQVATTPALGGGTIDGPAIGLAAQFALLGALGAGVGLSAAGWVVGSAYAVVICVTLGRALRRSGATVLGPANQVTLARGILVGGVAALIADSLLQPVPVAVLVILSAVALSLDAVDGQVARRTGSVSALGARFDMEVDAFLILALSIYVGRSLGWWVLAIGGLRYAFVAASFALPWLRGALPYRFSRKVVAAAQGIVLAVASAGVGPRLAVLALVGLSLAVLCWSFARDIRWLWEHARTPALS
ncbi:CDP-alcohol phosphatidyltransferase family protein [Actinomycetes bacterium KLBMP 9797]